MNKTIAIRFLFAFLIALFYSSPPAGAATDDWQNGDGYWGDISHWSLGSLPGSLDDAYILFTDDSNHTVNFANFDASSLSAEIQQLQIDSTGNGMVTFIQAGNTLATNNGYYAGSDGKAYVEHTGGTLNNSGDFFKLGANSGSYGYYHMNNTAQINSGNSEVIGWDGEGEFVQDNGTNSTDGNLYLGAGSGKGSYTLNDGVNSVGGYLCAGCFDSGSEGIYTSNGGELNIAGVTYLGLNAGTSGRFILNGGQVTAGTGGSGTTMIIGWDGEGRLDINGGNLVVEHGNEAVGMGYRGEVNQSGGTHRIEDGSLDIADPNSLGIYNLSGGALVVRNWETVGAGGAGMFRQFNDTTNVSILGVVVGDASSFNMYGGSLYSGQMNVGSSGNGYFTQYGGDVLLSFEDAYTMAGISPPSGGVSHNSPLRLGQTEGSAGIYTIEDGTLTAANGHIGAFGAGSFIQKGGTVSFNYYPEEPYEGNLRLGFEETARGTYDMSGGSLSAKNMQIGYYGFGSFVQTGGDVIAQAHTDSEGNYINGGRLYLGMYRHVGSPLPGGTYQLSNGSLSVKDLYAGYYGSGSFVQTGGTVNVEPCIDGVGNYTGHGNLYLGYGHQDDSPSSGTYQLSGGELHAQNEYIGYSGSGSFVQTGGSNQTDWLWIKNNQYEGAGMYDVSGGTLTANRIFSRGILNFRGGQINTDTVWNYGVVKISSDYLNASSSPMLEMSPVYNPITSFTNYGMVDIQNAQVYFNSNFINTENAVYSAKNSIVAFGGTFTNNGIQVIDPTTEVHINDHTVSTNGAITGMDSGSILIEGANFYNYSHRNQDWDTEDAALVFTDEVAPFPNLPDFMVPTQTTHDFATPAVDKGPTIAGYEDNFAWGQLVLDSGNTLLLQDGNTGNNDAAFGSITGSLGAVYVDAFLLGDFYDQDIEDWQGSLDDAISSRLDSEGVLNIYYLSSDPFSAYLGGQAYSFGSGSGSLIPVPGVVPEPISSTLFLIGSAVFGLVGYKRKSDSGR